MTTIARSTVGRARRRGWVWAAAGILGMIALGGLVETLKPWASPGFVEMRMSRRADVPISIAAAPDGTIWFTMEDAVGRLRNGAIQKIPRSVADVEPLGLAVDARGAAWFTDTPMRAIGRLGADGRSQTFPLPTSIVRLGRLAVATDGTVWFAEPSTVSVTRLQDGVFTRYMVGTPAPMGPTNAAPFGVAVDTHGTVWATLQNANQLVHFAPGSQMVTFDAPTSRSGLGDIAVDSGGAVWFLEVVANKVGRFASGRFQEFAVPTPSAGLTALAVAPDGAAWFTELRAHKLGRVYRETVTEFPLPREDARPFGLTVDAANNVWYTDLDGYVGHLPAERARS
jgi:virginiamycin B lyase